MAEAGFADRRFPDGRVLRLCSARGGATISAIGRELGITRQGASKVVKHLRERDYVTVTDSATSGREKTVTVTSRGNDYLRAQRAAARAIEDEVRGSLGDAAFTGLLSLLAVLDHDGQERMRAYLRRSSRL